MQVCYLRRFVGVCALVLLAGCTGEVQEPATDDSVQVRYSTSADEDCPKGCRELSQLERMRVRNALNAIPANSHQKCLAAKNYMLLRSEEKTSFGINTA